MACKDFSTDNLNLISAVSRLHLFLNFGRIPSCKHICALWRIYFNGKFEDCSKEALKELIQQDESDDEEGHALDWNLSHPTIGF